MGPACCATPCWTHQQQAAEVELLLVVTVVPPACAAVAAGFVLRRAGLSGAGLTDFADDVADLVASSTAAEGGRGSGLSDLFGKHKLSQRYGADLASQQQAQVGLVVVGAVLRLTGTLAPVDAE